MVVADGAETTRERKLLAWAAELAGGRAELAKTKSELAQARFGALALWRFAL
jgi:hypothetical protein